MKLTCHFSTGMLFAFKNVIRFSELFKIFSSLSLCISVNSDFTSYNSGMFSSTVVEEGLKSVTVTFLHWTFVLARSQMGTVDVKVSSGQLDVLKEKNLLVWGLGKRHFLPQS